MLAGWALVAKGAYMPDAPTRIGVTHVEETAGVLMHSGVERR